MVDERAATPQQRDTRDTPVTLPIPTLPAAWRSPESSRTLSRIIVAASFIAHASAALALRAGAAERTHVAPATTLDIELAPPPPKPKPEPEPEPEPETPPPPPAAAPPPPVQPPRRTAKPQAKAPPASAEPPPPAATGWSESAEGELPPAPPAPAPVVAPPPPPPPPPAAPAPVIEAKEGANYLKNPRPPYPRLAQREGWEGRVILRVKVLPNGRVGGATVQKSAGRSALDDAALEVVKGWTFVPATQGGKPIAGWVAVPFDFKLN